MCIYIYINYTYKSIYKTRHKHTIADTHHTQTITHTYILSQKSFKILQYKTMQST